ncbi:MAG: EAL domain-containing protein [Synergistaceae bacterium]
MPNKKKILIIDDNKVNRKILYKILSKEYQLFEAENGKVGIDFLKQTQNDISLVLLDINMPVMNGFEFLAVLKNDAMFSSIPVIVETSSDSSEDEITCLAEGASDFITKPYKPEIVKHRVASIIRLRETAAMINLLKFDQLTGLYTKEFFFQHVHRLLIENSSLDFDMICCDIENFKLVNDKYGEKKGDDVLRYIAQSFKNSKNRKEIYARIGPDKFAVFTEHNNLHSEDEIIEKITVFLNNAPVPNLVVKFGVYPYVDKTLPISAMCDRALIALNRIKTKYGKFIIEYDDSLRLLLLKEQQIIDHMKEALKNKEFVLYFQPKHDIRTDEVIGAEVLVRWNNPELGFISPGEFIPLFEKNGFISELDIYIWEETCKQIYEWKVINCFNLPISVNVSRVDFDIPNFVELMISLTDRYKIERSLLHLEVTESAYVDNPQQIIEIIKKLRYLGFKIEMDDFGSGYSSLNVLSELPIDVLKLDMGFIQKQNSINKKNILKFVVALARWLELDVIAEGVESAEQMEYLKNIGCNYVQGFFYSKPLPSSLFKEYLSKNKLRSDSTTDKNSEFFPENIFGDLNPHTVMIVEDIEMNCDILKNMLLPRYNVIVFNNGQDAYNYLLENPHEISIILLDLIMPIMDGFRLLDILKKDNVLSRIPVIITSEVADDAELRALRLGADNFVSKPYKKEILQHHIKNTIDSAELKRIKESLEDQRVILEQRANQDTLTMCCNRRGLMESISRLPELSPHAVFMVDVDNLKQCNDTYGHDVGDELIRKVADTLRAEIREGDIIARVGGDEFLIIMKNFSELQKVYEKGLFLSKKIKESKLKNTVYALSCSFGVSIMHSTDRFNEAFKHADIALYHVKQKNKGSCMMWKKIHSNELN